MPDKNRESVFLQQSSLDTNYLPDKLLCRDNAILDLIFNFRRILEEVEQPSISCLILGRSGVGKTAIARFFGRNFKKIADEKGLWLDIRYFNCLHYRTMSKIIRELLAIYLHRSGRGFANDETLKLILNHLIETKGYLLLIIDEVHILRPDEILSLLVISETFGHENVKISIILISRNKDWMRIETERILSRLNEKIKLEPYRFEGIKSILKYRIQLAFNKNVITERNFLFLSQIVHNNESLSNGVTLLRECGLKADKEGLNHITREIIETLSQEMYPTLRIKIIHQLKDQELFTLFGIVRALINRGEPFTLVDEAFEEYQMICEPYHINPHTIKNFRKYIQFLSKLNIISAKTVRIEEAERGRHLEISLIDITSENLEDLLITILDRKFN